MFALASKLGKVFKTKYIASIYYLDFPDKIAKSTFINQYLEYFPQGELLIS